MMKKGMRCCSGLLQTNRILMDHSDGPLANPPADFQNFLLSKSHIGNRNVVYRTDNAICIRLKLKMVRRHVLYLRHSLMKGRIWHSSANMTYGLNGVWSA